MESEIQKIHEFRRQGVSNLDLWQFVLSSNQRKQAWQSLHKNLAPFDHWEKILKSINTIQNAAEQEKIKATEALLTIPKELACEAVPLLVETINTENETLQKRVLDVIGKLGSKKNSPSLFALLTTSEEEKVLLRFRILETLKKLDVSSSEVVSYLLNSFEKANFTNRLKIVKILGEMGQAANESLPKLIHIFLSEENWELSSRAAYALGRMKVKATIPIFIKALQNRNHEIRRSVSWALGEFGKECKDEVFHLISTLEQEEDIIVRCNLLKALGGIGTIQVVPILQKTLQNDSNEYVRLAAIQGLEMTKEIANQTIPILETFLTDKMEIVRDAVSQAILKLS